MKLPLTIAGAVLVGTTLSACGGGSGSYCDDLKSVQDDFTGVTTGQVDAFEKSIETSHQLAEEAPDEVADAWKTFDGAITELEKAFEEAGIEPADLEKMQSGELPEGLDQEKLAELGTKLQPLFGDEFTQASDEIQKHAKDECDIDLEAS